MSNLKEILINKKICKSIWFMRQAGRYLPEFRQIREKNKNFLKLCFDSKLATEITLQPIKRFDLDAAIVFSDILVIPHALGQSVEFREKSGPHLPDFNINRFLDTSKNDFLSTLKPIYKTIKETRKILNKNKSLIAFVGAPWTLIIYLYNLRNKNETNRKISIENKKQIEEILKKLDEFLKLHIIQQKEAGADIVQIFDSWAGMIKEEDLNRFCYKPNSSLIDFCKTNNIPTICFPKGLNTNYKKFIEIVKPNAVNIDYGIDPLWAKENLNDVCIQGGMSPEILLQNEDKVLHEVGRYLEIFKNSPYIFNLGHGILPKTDPEIIKKIVNKVRQTKR